ncbi:MAG: hypothetical protein ACI4MG_05450 [Aristaeellaceae bacterium]
MKKTLAVLVAALMLCLLCVACAAAEDASLAGTYQLDASALGMPLNVYLIVDENNGFQWTNKLEDGVDKGHGTIGELDGLYMMVYSDSANDALKTATFTLDGVNLLFSTRVPYGSSGFSPNLENPEAPIYPVARKLLYTDSLGVYVGTLEVEAMGSAIVYEAELTLCNGAEYTLTSCFSMGGSDYTYEQQGTFAIADGQITLSCEGKPAQTGTIGEDGITAGLFLSQMASSPREIALKPAVTAEVAGVYTGVKDMSAMGVYARTTLTLDAVSGFTYVSSIEGEEDFVQSGSFTVDGETITLCPEGADPITCTLANDVLTAKLRINAGVPMATSITFYRDVVQGVFHADGEDANGSAVASTLTLNADGTYAIEVVTDGFMTYEETGTFATEASMLGVSLVLTATDGTVSTGVVDGTININHNVDAAFNTLGFKYVK